MIGGGVTDIVLRNKCRILGSRLQARLERVDHSRFPTKGTVAAQTTLLQVIAGLCEERVLTNLAPSALHRSFIKLASLVEDVEHSSIDAISWPIVGHCEYLWPKLFKGSPPALFYTTTSIHNYYLIPYSVRIEKILRFDLVLPNEVVGTLLGDAGPIYCLKLATSEEQNLPLYANIGHEFGHALFDSLSDDEKAEHDDAIESLYNKLTHSTAINGVPKALERRNRFLRYVIDAMAQELFADAVAVRLMGIAFLLSLYEMSWGQDLTTFGITPSGQTDPSAHPSFSFRTRMMLKMLELEKQCKAFASGRRSLPELTATCAFVADLPDLLASDDVFEAVVLRSDSDPDWSSVRALLDEQRDLLKSDLAVYVSAIKVVLDAHCNQYQVNPEVTCQLLERIIHGVLPDRIPGDSPETLFGKDANFVDILNAAAIRRVWILSARDRKTPIVALTDDIERLCAKAFEATLISQQFAEWKKAEESAK